MARGERRALLLLDRARGVLLERRLLRRHRVERDPELRLDLLDDALRLGLLGVVGDPYLLGADLDDLGGAGDERADRAVARHALQR